jgi:hypothetical protein
MNKRKFVVIFSVFFLIISYTFGEDKWQNYSTLYPILSNITRVDTELPSDLVVMYKINYYTRNISYITSVLSLIASIVCFSRALEGVNYRFYENAMMMSLKSVLISEVLLFITMFTSNSLENDIRNHYNNYISENNKSIGLKLNYQF